MKVLVLGKSGQVATALVSARKGVPTGWNVEAWGRQQLNLSDVGGIYERVVRSGAAGIINAAAYTAVDKAEREATEAAMLNSEAPAEVARAARQMNIPFVHISTDYVFSGDKSTPYVETDPIGPVSVYGRTKAEGESRVMQAHPGATILRTAWVFHEHGTNFVKTMLRLGREREEIRVVADQYGNPTYAGDIANACLQIIAKTAAGESGTGGIFHFSGSGHTTWHGFAVEIFTQAARLGLKVPACVLPITTADYPTPARRPANSRFDCTKIHNDLGIVPPDWRPALASCIEYVIKAEP
ncbi:dTDP-4-dehydrorhamnose reductase [Rhizobium sp. CG4]|uniref:dTDP-4-dehydrorhamnose reductase n=1 Tax=Rhizobium sp. CG4 TaxID=2726075 RepID=UPI002033803D|nr:dTDP-4-dehydrorhamnose reductase [Rhizobium sp. CG4]MCM2458009.1 dTDP-4-dehydrorhamnose reductase [Rhizobium sp. CG4]